MYRIAIGGNSGMANASVFIRKVMRLGNRFCTAAYGFGKGTVGIFNLKCNIPNAVAMQLYVIRGGVFGPKRRCKDKIYAPLPEHVTRGLAIISLQPRICHPRKPKRLAIIKFRLLRIANIKLNMMYSF